jgi:hypothetical protein
MSLTVIFLAWLEKQLKIQKQKQKIKTLCI